MSADEYTTPVQLVFLFEEIWRSVVGFEGWYDVSSIGRVRTCERDVLIPATKRRGPTWKHLKSQIRSLTHGGKQSPYQRVHLWREDHEICRMVHHLVLEAFVGPKPPGAVANHIDGDKRNNRVGNLEWCSRSYNNLHAIDIGLVRIRGEEHLGHKYSTEQVLLIRRLAKEGLNLKQIQRYVGIPYHSVWNIVARRTWKHVPEE